MAQRVFISSTSIDLQDYRQAVFRAIQGLGGYADDMIFWSADDRDGTTVSTDRVRQSDVVILLVAHRYGYVPDGSPYSVTELEFRAARDANVPVLAFLVDEDLPWPPRFVEHERATELARFKATIDKQVTRRTFSSADQLTALVTQSLVALANRPPSRSRAGVSFTGSARLISPAGALRTTPDADVRIGAAEDGLHCVLEVRRGTNVASLVASIANAVARPGVEPPVAILQTFQQAIEQHSRQVWAGERILPVTMLDGTRRDMFVARSTLGTLFRPLFAEILDSRPPRATNAARRRDATVAPARVGSPGTNAAALTGDASSPVIKALQSVGGQNRFLGIALDDGSVHSVGVQSDGWVEWRSFLFESLADNFPEARFALRHRGRSRATVDGAIADYVPTIEQEASRVAGDDGHVEIDTIFQLERRDVGRMLLAIATLVSDSHAQGRIHGDLKPTNIVLTPGRPTLIDDFDLKTGDVAPGWTPDWSSPEQVLGNPIAPSTDIYPLGVMVVRLLGGRLVGEVRKFKTAPLADGRDEFDVFYDPFIHVDPKQAVMTNAGLSAWLAFGRACLTFNPDQRVHSAARFVDRLAALLEEHPLQGRVDVSIPGKLTVARLPDGSQRVVRLIDDSPRPSPQPVAGPWDTRSAAGPRSPVAG